MTRRPRSELVALIGLVLIGLGGPFAYAAASPAYSSGDEAAHVDYALQVWHGRLPVFEDGLELQNLTGVHPPVQWTAQHPPLFYLLLAPVVGPLVDAGHVTAAALGARAVVVLLSLALVLGVRWTTRSLLPREPVLVADTAAAIVGLSVWFVRLGGSVYNDILAALVVALAFGLLLRLLRHPRSRLLWWGFTGAIAAAGLTRFSLLPLCAVLLSALVVHRLVTLRMGLWRAFVAPVLSGLALLATGGWFYLRNLILTGGLSGGHPDWALENTGRPHVSVASVAVDGDFWSTMLAQFSTPSVDVQPWAALAQHGVWILFITPVAAGVILLVRRLLRPGDLSGERTALAYGCGVIVLCCGLILAMQIVHTAGGGSALPRYWFALVPFVAPVMAVALVGATRLRWIGIGWLGLRTAMLAAELTGTLGRDLGGPQAPIFPAAAWAGYGAVVAGVLMVMVRIATDRRAAQLRRADFPSRTSSPS